MLKKINAKTIDSQLIKTRMMENCALKFSLVIFNQGSDPSCEIAIKKQNTQVNVCSAFCLPGSYLLSQRVAPQVPSAWEGLTAVFGMGTGGSLPLSPPDYKMKFSLHPENCIESFG